MSLFTAGETVSWKAQGLELIGSAPVTWDEWVPRMKSSELQEFERWLTSVSERAARLAAYVGARGANGCGDQGHERAVREQNRTAAKVRKALGYTQARHDINF
jgi:hypothetical protein